MNKLLKVMLPLNFSQIWIVLVNFSKILKCTLPVRKTSPSNFLQRPLTMAYPIPLLAPVTYKIITFSLNMLGKIFSWQQGDNLYEMLKPIFWEKNSLHDYMYSIFKLSLFMIVCPLSSIFHCTCLCVLCNFNLSLHMIACALSSIFYCTWLCALYLQSFTIHFCVYCNTLSSILHSIC